MVDEVVLHIGMHKTGTTSIQRSLRDFDDGSVRMARLFDENHSIPIYSLISKKKYEYQVHRNHGRTPAQIDELNRQTERDLEAELSLDRQVVVLSGEDIVMLDREEVDSLVTLLKRYAKKVRVLAYIREPSGFASSALQQYVVGGLLKMTIPNPNFKGRFLSFIQCDKIDKFEFVEFKRSGFVQDSVVLDFCNRVGIGMDGSDFTEKRVNEGLSFECVQLIYHFNKFGMPAKGSSLLTNSRMEMIYHLQHQIAGSKFKLREEWVYEKLNMADVEWMRQHIDFDLVPDANKAEKNAEGPDILESLEQLMSDIKPHTLADLQKCVAVVDENVAKDTNITTLLNVLFSSIVLKNKQKAQSEASASQLAA